MIYAARFEHQDETEVKHITWPKVEMHRRVAETFCDSIPMIDLADLGSYWDGDHAVVVTDEKGVSKTFNIECIPMPVFRAVELPCKVT